METKGSRVPPLPPRFPDIHLTITNHECRRQSLPVVATHVPTAVFRLALVGLHFIVAIVARCAQTGVSKWAREEVMKREERVEGVPGRG